MRSRGFRGLNYTERLYRTDFSQRWALSGFIKDTSVAEKRLTALADQYTNTIVTLNGSTVFRPSPLSCYSGNLSSLSAAWWPAWKQFMFHSPLTISRGASGNFTLEPIARLRKLSAMRYPAIKLREETVSLALQTLSLAIFDATLLQWASRSRSHDLLGL